MIKSLKDLLTELRVQSINLVLTDEDNLEIVSYSEKISSDLIHKIKDQKENIINYLKSHNDESNTNFQLVEKSENYVLSSPQKGMWIVSQSELASIAYNMPSSVELNEIYDVSFLEKAIESVIDRHEILRTVFKQDSSGEIKQIVKDRSELAFKIDFNDFRYVDGKDAKMNALMKQDLMKSFDLENGPLLRVSLFQTSNDCYVLYFNMHHIIGDAWSIDILNRDVKSFYNAYQSNSQVDLPELRIQYKEYAAWEFNQLESGKMQKHKEFWLDNFAEKVPTLNLPSYHERPKFKTYNGRYLLTKIVPTDVQRLKKMTQSEGGTLFMGVVTVLKILLYKYTNERDIVIGFPNVNRTNEELKNQIGFYVRTLALRNKLNAEDSFLTFFKKVKQNIFSAVKNQDYPFEKLVGDLNLKADVSRNPIFDISVTFHNVASVNSGIINEEDYFTIKRSEAVGINCKNDIEFHVKEIGDSLSFNVNYNVSVYDEEMITRFMLNFKHLLSEVLNNPNEKISAIDYLSKEEKHRLLYEFNDTKVAYQKGETVIDYFEYHVQKKPNAIAVVYEQNELTYKELNDLSNQFSYSLQKNYGIKKGDAVGVHLERSEWSIISILGIMKSGGVYVPIDPELPNKRKAFMAEDTRLKLLITETSFLFELDFYQGKVFSIDVEFEPSSDIHYVKSDLKNNDLAYILYTSGSTGNPKGVMIEHSGILNTALSQTPLFDLHGCKNNLQFASFSFDASLWDIFLTLLSGKSLYVLSEKRRKDIKLFESYIEENNIQMATLPPAYLKLLNTDSLKSLKVLITAGESAIYDKVSEYLKYGSFYNAYGPTESSICATMFKVEKGSILNNSIIPIGKPIANTSIYILDEFNKLQPEGVIGEICIGGTGLALGYLNQPELTAEKFIDNPFVEGEKIYKSGDLGRWLPDGNIEFHGRIDDQIKIQGYRIELGEIEQSISNQNFINQVVVTVKEKKGEKFLIAYFVAEHKIDKKELQNSLSKTLPVYMLPNYYVQLDSIPLNNNGKIDKKSLPDIEDKDVIEEEYVEARTNEEKILVSILLDVLKLNQISVKHSLYDLGIQSIIIMQLVFRLKQSGYTIAVDELLNYPIIEDLAEFIKTKYSNQVQLESKREDFFIEDDSESDVIPEKNNYHKEWKYGDVIALSPNQYRFFKLPHLKGTYDFEMLDFSEEKFENEFRSFLSKWPTLTLKFQENSGQIFQQYISSQEIKFKLLIEDLSLKENDELQKIGESFSLKSWNLLHDELIRVFVVRDQNKASIYLTIPYIFLDTYSNLIFHDDLVNFFKGNKKEMNYYHPFTFISYQNEFLKSKKGLEERKYWIETLKKIPMINHDTNVLDSVTEPVMLQSTFISGDNFEKLKMLAQKFNLPLSAFFNSFFEMILNDYNCNDKKIYGVLIDGRELEIENLDVTKIIGVINNMLPLTYIDYSCFTIDGIIKCYSKYLNSRNYQRIPYETICDDLVKVTGNELNKNIIGYFNFKIIDSFKSINDSESIVTNILKTNLSTYDICLSCDLHQNGIAVRLFILDKIYEQKKETMSLKKYIYKFLEIINNQ